ncbi:hypothetical protein N806_05035 [Rhodococcus sp. P27]|nr:hypothetical protein N806_05035 [Rhodococcus sp. P27]
MSNVVEDAPGWFTRALEAPVETGSVEVEGASVHFRAWGSAGPGIVLIHGGAATVAGGITSRRTSPRGGASSLST